VTAGGWLEGLHGGMSARLIMDSAAPPSCSRVSLQAKCSCSREAVSSMLKSFEAKDRAEMVKDGKVVVTCEFCSSVYEFTPHEAGVEEGA